MYHVHILNIEIDICDLKFFFSILKSISILKNGNKSYNKSNSEKINNDKIVNHWLH